MTPPRFSPQEMRDRINALSELAAISRAVGNLDDAEAVERDAAMLRQAASDQEALVTKDAEIAALKAELDHASTLAADNVWAVAELAEMRRKVKALEKELAHALSTAALREMDRPTDKRVAP